MLSEIQHIPNCKTFWAEAVNTDKCLGNSSYTSARTQQDLIPFEIITKRKLHIQTMSVSGSNYYVHILKWKEQAKREIKLKKTFSLGLGEQTHTEFVLQILTRSLFQRISKY